MRGSLILISSVGAGLAYAGWAWRLWPSWAAWCRACDPDGRMGLFDRLAVPFLPVLDAGGWLGGWLGLAWLRAKDRWSRWRHRRRVRRRATGLRPVGWQWN